MSRTELICTTAADGLASVPNASLIFADPPFDIGARYSGYSDKLGADAFEQMIHKTLYAAVGALSETGVLAIHGPDNVADITLAWARKPDVRPLMRRVAWLNWRYDFGVCTKHNWIDARCHCIVFGRVGRKSNFFADQVLIESARVKYKDKRVKDSLNGGKRVPGTVWPGPNENPEGWSRVSGTNAERCPARPNQLPELYLERLILAYTKPGDLVCDPFLGTGTTAVVAEALGREFIGFDVDPDAIDVAKGRLRKGAVRVPSGRYL